jgi:hypothetical protein
MPRLAPGIAERGVRSLPEAAMGRAVPRLAHVAPVDGIDEVPTVGAVALTLVIEDGVLAGYVNSSQALP